MKYMILLYSDPVETKRMSALNRDERSQKHSVVVIVRFIGQKLNSVKHKKTLLVTHYGQLLSPI